jgi:hypothetical protein
MTRSATLPINSRRTPVRTVGSHDYEIDAVFLRGPDDRCCSWPFRKQRGDADALSLR